MSKLRLAIKGALAKVMPDSGAARYLAWLGRFDAWRAQHMKGVPQFPDRFTLYRHLQEKVIGQDEICYLEFGVYQGDSIREWASIHQKPGSRFRGFDTFTGLPESWDSVGSRLAAGHFSTGGQTPQINDARVGFVRGLFQDTLPGYIEQEPPPANQRLVIHNDSDLYTSTLYVLGSMDRHIRPGALIIFDEFSSVLHEFRAFEDYAASWQRKYRVLGATPRLEQLALEIL